MPRTADTLDKSEVHIVTKAVKVGFWDDTSAA